MFIKRSDYEEQQNEIKKIQESLREAKGKICKLEFWMNNHPKYKTGDVIGDWKVNGISVYEKPARPYYYNTEYQINYKCINCKDNKIGDFTEDELSDLKKEYERKLA
jgi:hypothetical protein